MVTFDQLDPKWKALFLGRTWLNASRWGCTTFALSVMSERFGCYRSPEDIAGNPKHYNRKGEIIWENVDFERMKFEKRIRRKDLAAINDSIAPGRGVLVQVNWTHWLLVLRKEGERFIGFDPLGGEEIDILKKYRYITGSAHYTAI